MELDEVIMLYFKLIVIAMVVATLGVFMLKTFGLMTFNEMKAAKDVNLVYTMLKDKKQKKKTAEYGREFITTDAYYESESGDKDKDVMRRHVYLNNSNVNNRYLYDNSMVEEYGGE